MTKDPKPRREAQPPARGEALAAPADNRAVGENPAHSQAAPAVENVAQRKAREVAAWIAAHPEKRAKARSPKPLPEASPEENKPTSAKVRTDVAPRMPHTKAGNVEAANREWERWKKENGLPEGVDPLSMQARAALTVARSAHQREKAKPLLTELRQRLADALDTARALARELAWPMPPMPTVLENVETEAPSAWALAKAAHLPDSAEIVDFLGRAVVSADVAIKKMPKGGPRHSVLGVLGTGLSDAGVPDPTAVDFLVGVKLEKNDSRPKAIGRQRTRGSSKRQAKP